MKVVIAPDKFKATLTATEACEAIAMGVRAVLPEAEIVTFPMSDGWWPVHLAAGHGSHRRSDRGALFRLG
jgi:glycerate kinase